MQNLHEGHRERLKQEFLQKGMEHLPDHEKLELLLYFSIKRGDTNETGHELMNRFGSLSGVFNAPYELLKQTKGIGESSAQLIKLVSSLVRAYMDDYSSQHNTIKTTAEAKEYMRYKFLCESVECVMMACIGGNGKVVFCDVISEGSPETVQIRPSDFIRKALLAQAARVVIAHNHPNGICNPSGKDVFTTKILADELSRVEIELMDHIIVAPDGCCSMQEIGMMKNNPAIGR
jgi:DNA repair protein RadC